MGPEIGIIDCIVFAKNSVRAEKGSQEETCILHVICFLKVHEQNDWYQSDRVFEEVQPSMSSWDCNSHE